jgi:hypothetical protein
MLKQPKLSTSSCGIAIWWPDAVEARRSRAAWETLYYCMHPEQFHWDAHGVKDDAPLWVWELSATPQARASVTADVPEVYARGGSRSGHGLHFNKTEKTFEFANGTLLEFKSADDPESLRGAGLDILWMDEAAFIRAGRVQCRATCALRQAGHRHLDHHAEGQELVLRGVLERGS